MYLRDYEIQPGETLTVSAWGLSGHFGVAYNLEPQFVFQNGRYVGRKSVSISIDESKLGVIAEYIEKHPKWKFVENCSYWSLHLWNEVVDEPYRMKTQILLYTPTRVQKAMQEFTNLKTDIEYIGVRSAFFYEDNARTELRLCQ